MGKNIKYAVIIAEEWQSSNLGDEVICNTFQKLFQEYGSNKNIRLVPLPISIHKMNLIEKIIYYILRVIYKKTAEEYTQMIRSKNITLKMRELLSKYHVQKLIFAGGAVFQKYFVRVIHSIINECTRCNIPVFFNACGYGPNTGKSLSFFKSIIAQPCIKQITTRDTISDIAPQNVMVIPDNLYDTKNYPFPNFDLKSPSRGLTNNNETLYYINMDKAVQDEIEKLIKIMADTVPVEKIYLFGSYAYGAPHKDSDLDFYVVLKPGVTLRPIEAGVQIRMAMSRIQNMPLDVLVNHHDVFFQRLTQPTLERKIVRDGVLLYGENV